MNRCPSHWFQYKAIQFRLIGGRHPVSPHEWLRCMWNADLFYGPVPTVKTIAAVSWLIAWIS